MEVWGGGQKWNKHVSSYILIKLTGHFVINIHNLAFLYEKSLSNIDNLLYFTD